MKAPHKLLKAAAVGCSVLLAAGFVSYRAGAFDSLLHPAPTVVEPVPVPAADESAQPTPVTKGIDPAVFSSSKSIILTPVTPTPGGSTALPGSKSAPVFEPPPATPAPKTVSPAPGSPK